MNTYNYIKLIHLLMFTKITSKCIKYKIIFFISTLYVIKTFPTKVSVEYLPVIQRRIMNNLMM